MSVQYYVASSLDGFIAAPDDGMEWLLQFGMEPYQERFDAFLADVGAIVMGSTTYEVILSMGDDGAAYGDRPVWVLTSRQLPRLPGVDIRFAAGDLGAILDQAGEAAGRRNVWLVGGGSVAARAADLGLLDELIVTVMPIVLGAGTPLLPLAGPTPPLELRGCTPFSSGAVELVYAVPSGA